MMNEVMLGTYLYLYDILTPVELTFSELVQAFEEDPIKPYMLLKELVEEKTGKVKDVKLYKSYFSPSTKTAVLEYFIKVEEGTLGVKIVHAEKPSKALMEYHKAERSELNFR